MEYEVPTTPHTDKVTRLDKPLNLCGCLQECEAMVLRSIICPVDGDLKTPKRLHVDPAYTGCQEHRKPNQQAHSSHYRYPLEVGVVFQKAVETPFNLFVNICIAKHKVPVTPSKVMPHTVVGTATHPLASE